MSDPREPWPNNPNAPKIAYSLYALEKATFAGIFVGSILYGTLETHCPRQSTNTHPARRPLLGMLFVLFSKCIAALLNPLYRKRDRIKWVLVSYTVA